MTKIDAKVEEIREKARKEGRPTLDIMLEMGAEGLTIMEAVVVFAKTEEEQGETVHYFMDSAGTKAWNLANDNITLEKSRWQPHPL